MPYLKILKYPILNNFTKVKSSSRIKTIKINKFEC